MLVRSFGTLEVHGDRKLPWTKLSETALKLESTDGILEVQVITNMLGEAYSRRRVPEFRNTIFPEKLNQIAS